MNFAFDNGTPYPYFASADSFEDALMSLHEKGQFDMTLACDLATGKVVWAENESLVGTTCFPVEGVSFYGYTHEDPEEATCHSYDAWFVPTSWDDRLDYDALSGVVGVDHWKDNTSGLYWRTDGSPTEYPTVKEY